MAVGAGVGAGVGLILTVAAAVGTGVTGRELVAKAASFEGAGSKVDTVEQLLRTRATKSAIFPLTTSFLCFFGRLRYTILTALVQLTLPQGTDKLWIAVFRGLSVPEEDQNSSNPPTWADFKPPVLTTPFGVTPGSSTTSSENVDQDAPISPATDSVPEAVSAQSWVETPPASVEPVVSYQPVNEDVATAPVPAEVPTVVPEEPGITKEPINTPEPEVLPNQAPQQSAQPSQPSSRHDDDFLPPAADETPEVVTSAEPETAPEPIMESAPEPDSEIITSPPIPNDSPEPAPVESATPLEVVSVPAAAPVPVVSEARPSTPIPPVTKPTSSPVKKIAAIMVGLVILLSASAGGFYIWNNPPASSPEVDPAKSSENTAILADSESPSSWENNYSTTLLSSERGGLEFLTTDPPATGSATPQSDKVELTSLKVKVAKVDLHLATQSVVASGVSPESTKSANKAIDRWETLRLNANTTVDLMDLRNKGGALSSLGITYLAAGRYTEIRLFITKATGITKDGTSIDIEIPGKTGLIKLVKSFNVSTTGTLKLIVDFDAPSMVIKSGDTYQLRPVVAKVIYNDQEI